MEDIEHSLVGDIYDAALNAELWPAVFTRIADTCNGDLCVFTATDVLNPAYNLMFARGLSEQQMTEYREGGYDKDEQELFERIISRPDVGIGTGFVAEELYGSIEAYQALGGRYLELLRRYGIVRKATVALENLPHRISGFGMNNSEQQPFRPGTGALLTRLAPHFRRSLQIHRQMIEVKRVNARLYQLFDLMLTGVILLDSQGRVSFSNPAATSLLTRHRLLDITRTNHLRAKSPAQDARLQALINGSIRASHREYRDCAGGVLGLANREGDELLKLTVVPLSELAGYAELARESVAAAVFLNDPQRGITLSAPLLASSYGLTAREIEIAERFVNKADVAGIASQAGLALDTVRQHLKAIYDKTGQRSQADLMRLLTGLRTDFQHIG